STNYVPSTETQRNAAGLRKSYLVTAAQGPCHHSPATDPVAKQAMFLVITHQPLILWQSRPCSLSSLTSH
ncbi:hypothetical protein RRG08_067168, partial [Elysia crispata]